MLGWCGILLRLDVSAEFFSVLMQNLFLAWCEIYFRLAIGAKVNSDLMLITEFISDLISSGFLPGLMSFRDSFPA